MPRQKSVVTCRLFWVFFSEKWRWIICLCRRRNLKCEKGLEKKLKRLETHKLYNKLKVGSWIIWLDKFKLVYQMCTKLLGFWRTINIDSIFRWNKWYKDLHNHFCYVRFTFFYTVVLLAFLSLALILLAIFQEIQDWRNSGFEQTSQTMTLQL